MANRDRVYESMLKDHFQRIEQMLLVSGARQVGKTTDLEIGCRLSETTYS